MTKNQIIAIPWGRPDRVKDIIRDALGDVVGDIVDEAWERYEVARKEIFERDGLRVVRNEDGEEVVLVSVARLLDADNNNLLEDLNLHLKKLGLRIVRSEDGESASLRAEEVE